ncbi:siderophore ferric iron reductase [Vibrio sp. CAIM 722]|uniref:Siderophore ferric iron reductase n=1 Tax=Vibrio eleionomae TaxID=2653505 RepID=A0A7X4RUV4_9VIBR|nr:siderophore ferric iron reductase [Vibrio eleionomae]MZI93908.1 siderophore ferric iron reductase [Vibrio eleionomae]
MAFQLFSIIDPRFELLFEKARSVTPYLDGKICSPDNNVLLSSPQKQPEISAWIKELYQALERNHPEAGSSYWLTRTWEILCWQPIFLSFIAVYDYELNAVPPISQIAQYRDDTFVTGYSFKNGQWKTSDHQGLIRHCAHELNVLFEGYREAMSDWTRIRPGFTRHLIVDAILTNVARLRATIDNFSDDDVIQEATYWLEALDLPLKHLDVYKRKEGTGTLRMVRASCCQDYRRDGGHVCCNCPGKARNKSLEPYHHVA